MTNQEMMEKIEEQDRKIAALMEKTTQQRDENGISVLAEGEGSNVSNFTPNYGLPLPIGTDIMRYQDFINEPMSKIDSALQENKENAANAQEEANAASSAASAADGKIEAVVNELNEWNIPQLIQTVNNHETRIANLESIVNSSIVPEAIPVTHAGNQIGAAIKTGRMLFVCGHSSTIRINTNGMALPYGDYTQEEAIAGQCYEQAQMVGNVLNLPTSNEYYKITNALGNYSDSTNNTEGTGIAKIYAIFNGVNTIIYCGRITITNNAVPHRMQNIAVPILAPATE